MNNYYASEHGLTKQTKVLWENKPGGHVYPVADFDPKPYVKPKYMKQPKNISIVKISEEEVETFQMQRIFAAIRGMN